ncbi:MAG: protein kinase [Planctomycetales bacterium]|nr:protein kinase [Planctomycetales bacterium]
MSRLLVRPDAPRISALRTGRSMSSEELARQAGCSSRAIQRLESGDAASIWLLDRVADALGTATSDLLPPAPREGRWLLRYRWRDGDPAPPHQQRAAIVQKLLHRVPGAELATDGAEDGDLTLVAEAPIGEQLQQLIAGGEVPWLLSAPGWLAPLIENATETPTLTFCRSTEQDEFVPAWTDSNDRELEGIFEPGKLISDRYLIHHSLGRGAMGRVFLATDQRLDRQVAMKVVAHTAPPHAIADFGSGTGPFTKDEEALIQAAHLEAALAREARMGANLNHRAIATVLDYGFVGNKSYTIFELVTGERLREVLDRRETIPLTEVCQLVGELAAALDFAHSRGIIHRDLKPENLCCQADGQIKILDLGIARDVTSEVQSQSYSGTPAYSSPEQARCMPTTGKSDQYALALIAFELLTGRRIFESSDPVELLQQQMHQAPPPLRDVQPGASATAEAALLRALSKDPADRFATCQEFAGELARALHGAADPVAPYLVGIPEQDRIAFYFSHVADDSLVAKRIAEGLEEAGHACWYCGRDAIPGVPFRRQSQAAIRRSAANVLLISRPALNSPDFPNEIEQAHEINCPLLPILVDISQEEFEKVNPSWRLLLGGVAAVEFRRRDPLESLLARLQSAATALGIPASRSPAPSRGGPQVEVLGQSWATDAHQIAIQDLDRVVYRNDLIDDFLRRRQRHFLSGTKGIGKTLLLTYKRHLLAAAAAEKGGSVTMIPEGRPYLDFMSEMRSLSSKYERPLSSLSTTKRLWSMALRVSVVSHHPTVVDPGEQFELDEFPSRIRRWLQGAKVQPSVVFKELTSLQISPLNQLIDATENFLDQKVREIHSPTFIFVDRVDQAIRDLSRDAWIYIQAGLIEAGWDMMNANSHLKVYATIRQEAFTNYESDIKSNLFGATTSLQYSDDELAAILDQLTSCYEGRQQFASFVGFRVIRHPARPEPEDCFQFIRRHTFGRPRDLVVIAGELASRRGSLNEKMASETVRELASSTLVSNIFEEVRMLHDCLHDRDVRSQFLGMLPTNILERAEVVALCEQFNGLSPGTLQHFGEDSAEVHHPFRDLYLSGLLGVIEDAPELGERVQRFRQPRDMLTRSGHELPDSEYYLIHPALNAYIRQHRTRDPYRQVQHIATGEGQLWRAFFPVIIALEQQLQFHNDQRFVAAIHQLVKRTCSFLHTGSTEFARGEIQANAHWDYVQGHDDAVSRETLLWLEELMDHL